MVYRRTEPNLRRLEKALAPFHPYPRGAPEGLPFEWSWRTLESGLNFTLTTDVGFIDLLGEVAGGGSYERLVAESGLDSVTVLDLTAPEAGLAVRRGLQLVCANSEVSAKSAAGVERFAVADEVTEALDGLTGRLTAAPHSREDEQRVSDMSATRRPHVVVIGGTGCRRYPAGPD